MANGSGYIKVKYLFQKIEVYRGEVEMPENEYKRLKLETSDTIGRYLGNDDAQECLYQIYNFEKVRG